jgi:hypothetical protein
VGTKVVYEGIDLLTVDVDTKLITNATTSEDDIAWAKGLSYNPAALFA